jgi:hypothetical protein
VLLHHRGQFSHLITITTNLISYTHHIRHSCVHVFLNSDNSLGNGLITSLNCIFYAAASQLVDHRLSDTLLPFNRELLVSIDNIVIGLFLFGRMVVYMYILVLKVDVGEKASMQV